MLPFFCSLLISDCRDIYPSLLHGQSQIPWTSVSSHELDSQAVHLRENLTLIFLVKSDSKMRLCTQMKIRSVRDELQIAQSKEKEYKVANKILKNVSFNTIPYFKITINQVILLRIYFPKFSDAGIYFNCLLFS